MTQTNTYTAGKGELEDAMRGILWEEQWRGLTLDDIPDPDFLKNRAKTWLRLPRPERVEVGPGWPERFCGWGSYGWKNEAVVRSILDELDHKPVIIDTAEGYGFGKVETKLGEIFKAYGHQNLFLMSKVSRNHLGSSTAVVNAARRSRDKLGQPLDLYQIHWPPPKRNYDSLMSAMACLLEEGTIKRVGVSNFCAGQIFTAQHAAQLQGFPIESLQVRVNRLDPSALDYLIPVAKALGLRVIAHSPFGQGKSWAENRRWLADHLNDIRATGVDYIIPGSNNPSHMLENMKIGAKK